MNPSENGLSLVVVDAAKMRSRLTEAVEAAKKRLRTTEAVDAAKKPSHLINALIVVGLFLLGIVLPPAYKVFKPFLFVIPSIIAVANKTLLAGKGHRNLLGDQTCSPPMPGRIPSLESYADVPKDPKDPRRYRPIG